uniref:Uncharacterized protein n=1 Tax=viral metagenome TaxID=1070528 RepID=A0A6M3IYU5_9ZZZZ
MKIYNRIVIDTKNNSVIEEEFFDYSGPVDLCKGGGGGGGSGRVDYPEYMKNVHSDWLYGTDSINSVVGVENITAIMATAIGASPFSGETAYDPDVELDYIDVAVAGFNTAIDALSNTTDYNTAVAAAAAKVDSTIVTSAYIQEDVDEFAAALDDQIESRVIPRYEAGMSDINAVISSAFPIGRAVIEGFRNRDVAKHASGLRLQLDLERNRMILDGAGSMIKALHSRVELEGKYAALITDAKRIRVIAMKEQNDQDIALGEADARWDMEVFQYGANVMASIGSASVATYPAGSSMSKSQSALSGAAAGAAIGTAGGTPGWGTVIGAVVGGIGGYLSA